MKPVFASESEIRITLFRNVLEAEGIRSHVAWADLHGPLKKGEATVVVDEEHCERAVTLRRLSVPRHR